MAAVAGSPPRGGDRPTRAQWVAAAIVGAHVLGPAAGELIHELALAMRTGIGLDEVVRAACAGAFARTFLARTEFGVKLRFTPNVTNTGTIRLAVEPEVSSLDFANGLTFQGFEIPALITRRTSTNVELRPGQHVRLPPQELRAHRWQDLAIVFQIELRGSTKHMKEFSAAGFSDYLDIIRRTISDGQAAGEFRTDIKPIVGAKILYGALDEMVTNWVLSEKAYPLEPLSGEVLKLFFGGVWAK